MQRVLLEALVEGFACALDVSHCGQTAAVVHPGTPTDIGARHGERLAGRDWQRRTLAIQQRATTCFAACQSQRARARGRTPAMGTTRPGFRCERAQEEYRKSATVSPGSRQPPATAPGAGPPVGVAASAANDRAAAERFLFIARWRVGLDDLDLQPLVAGRQRVRDRLRRQSPAGQTRRWPGCGAQRFAPGAFFVAPAGCATTAGTGGGSGNNGARRPAQPEISWLARSAPDRPVPRHPSSRRPLHTKSAELFQHRGPEQEVLHLLGLVREHFVQQVVHHVALIGQDAGNELGRSLAPRVG